MRIRTNCSSEGCSGASMHAERTNCSREECSGASMHAENYIGTSRNSPRKRGCHGWPLYFQVLRGFLKYFVTFSLRVHRAFTTGGPACESYDTGTGNKTIREEEGSKSVSRLRIYELWNVWSF